MLKMNESTKGEMLIRAKLVVMKNGLLKQSCELGGCHGVQEAGRTAVRWELIRLRMSHYRRSQGAAFDSLPFDWRLIFAHIYEIWCEVLMHLCIEYAWTLNEIPLLCQLGCEPFPLTEGYLSIYSCFPCCFLGVGENSMNPPKFFVMFCIITYLQIKCEQFTMDKYEIV